MMSSSEKQFDDAADHVEQWEDQGLSPERAWNRADPTGEIRKAQKERQAKADREAHRMGAQAAQQVEIDSRLAEIEKILDPKEREKELIYYNAIQIAKRRNKERNF